MYPKGLRGHSEWLGGAFSAADLLMATVLSSLTGAHILEDDSSRSAYVARGEARPAYQRAVVDQLAVFTAASNA
ncbi:hypothetical protein ACLEPN_11500 [Myxococcus sp. 1LA]